VVLRLREGWKAAGEGAKGKPRMSHAWSNSKNWDKRGLWAFGVVFCAPGMANTALPRLWGRQVFLLTAFLHARVTDARTGERYSFFIYLYLCMRHRRVLTDFKILL